VRLSGYWQRIGFNLLIQQSESCLRRVLRLIIVSASGGEILKWKGGSMVTWIALLGAGILCGFLNVAASSGSAISLPILLALGMPPAIANGTNRLPVLVGMATAIWRFQKSNAIPWRLCLRLLPALLISALVGAQMAAMLPMEQIRVLVRIAVVLALVLLTIKPQRWLRDGDPESTQHNPSLTLIGLTAGIGLWNGLIVLDSGTYLLMSLVMVGGLALQQASAVKAVLLGAATVVTLAVFIDSGQVAWWAAWPLMLGSALGGWLGALLALGPNSRIWIYRLLIAALSLELVAMVFGWQHPAMRMLKV